MAADEVFTIPFAVKLDGLNLSTKQYEILFRKKIDDFRLTAGNDTLIATYPRTGKLSTSH